MINLNSNNIIASGKNIDEAKKALIMIHGRGANASDILSLAGHLHVSDYALLAPQADNNSWYPFSFMVKQSINEPWLSSSLQMIKGLVDEIKSHSIAAENIYLLGFSQGACLTLEFAARNATKYGGIVAFTGGLIGDKIYNENYKGDFNKTPVFIGSSNPDPHVPAERVIETTGVLRKMNADLTQKLYNGMGHTISDDEINLANKLIFAA